MTARDAARYATVGLVVVRDGAVTWMNAAAQVLVLRHGATWDGPHSPVGALGVVRPGFGRTALRWPSPQGGTRWWEVTSTDVDGTGSALLYEITDETARYEADGRDLGTPSAQWRLSRMEAMVGMGSWVWNLLDDSIEWSESLMVMFGFAPGTELNFHAYRDLIHPDDRLMVEATLAEAIKTAKPFSYSHRLCLVEGSPQRVFECFGEVFVDAMGTPVRLLGTARDITEQHRARQELAYLAEHDPLTGIANRRSIPGWLAEGAAGPHQSALLLIDIDNFKDINDLRGHAAGDRVIGWAARTIAAHISPGAQLGRLGGDEFAVVVPRCDPPVALALAERLCVALAAATMVGEDTGLRITISIGVATISPGQNAETSLAQADLALYAAKNSGRNRARLFAPDQYHQAARRVSLIQRVSTALDAGSMQLDVQPILDLAAGRIDRHEVLLRLQDGREPALRPQDFLPDAQRTDLGLRLDRWVLEQAVQALASPRARAANLQLEVNVSARSLEDPDLARFVLDRLAQVEVDPRRLGLELNETTAVGSLDATRALAAQLTRAGCGFALDHFGAGLASFSTLKRLPFTAVKIAGEFVQQLDTDPVDRALVAAVVGVARELGMRTVAGQVDRAALVPQLRTLGVDDGQGHHFGRPQPLPRLVDDL